MLSLLPASYFQGAPAAVRFPGADKVVHAIMYAALTGLALWSRYEPGAPVRSRPSWFTAAAATAYGLLMEVLQGFTATRSMDIFDGLADAGGAFLVAGVWFLLTRCQAPAAGMQ